MYQLIGMQGMQRPSCFTKNRVDSLVENNRIADLFGTNGLDQGEPVDLLHRDEAAFLVLVQAVQHNQIRMKDLRERSEASFEPIDCIGIGVNQHLQRDGALRVEV